MGRLIIIRGLPGSGKSTLAKSIGIVHFEADQFHTKHNGIYDWKPENVKMSHKWCYFQVATNLTLGLDVVVSNTFAQFWEVEDYILFCKENGVDYSIIRCEGNIHSVPDDVLQKMKNRFEDIEGEIYVHGSSS